MSEPRLPLNTIVDDNIFSKFRGRKCILVIGLILGIGALCTGIGIVVGVFVFNSTGAAPADVLTEDLTQTSSTTTGAGPALTELTEDLTQTSSTTTADFIENETPVYTEEYLEEKIENLAAQFAQYSEDLEQTKAQLGDRLEKLEKAKEQRVNSSFYAFRSGGSLETELKSYDVIKFSHVRSNIGGHYNLETGYYTCPVDGMYFFSLSLTSQKYVSAFFTSERGTILEIAFQRSEASYLVTVTGSIVHDCQAGERVRPGSQFTTVLTGWSNMNSFSGFLIAEM